MFGWAVWRRIDKVEREWNGGISDTCARIEASPRAAWLVSRVTGLLVAAALIGGLGFAAPAAAQVSDQPPAVKTLTPERIAASAAGMVALIGAAIGGLALARSAGRVGAGHGRRGAIAALVLALIGLVIGGLVVGTADGGPGTGNGLAGGIVAMAVGLIGMALGGLALARSRRIA
jgi:hypothetical protein